MKVIHAVVLVALSFATPAYLFGQKTPADQELLQGVWKVVTAKASNPDVATRFEGKLLKFDKDMIFTYGEMVRPENLIDKLSFTIDPKKNPKEIDLFGYLNAGKKGTVPLLGIIAVEKEQVKLSWSMRDGRERPESFELAPPEKKSRQISLVLKRVKEEKK